jgi:hypothetical protein
VRLGGSELPRSRRRIGGYSANSNRTTDAVRRVRRAVLPATIGLLSVPADEESV